MPRGRPIDPDSLTQRILAELADEQWKDTHELARVLGAPARRVGDICSFLMGQGILENATQPLGSGSGTFATTCEVGKWDGYPDFIVFQEGPWKSNRWRSSKEVFPRLR